MEMRVDSADVNDDLEARLQDEAVRSRYPESFPDLPRIPTRRYHDRAFYDLEIEHIWRASWLIACHTSEIGKADSWRTFERFGLSIIVSKAADGVVRAFHNVCQHRGAPLVLGKSGVTSRFVCPYHAWSYASDGRLVGIPERKDFCGIERNGVSLRAVRCEVWQGLVFINLSEDSLSLAEFLAPIDQRVDDFPLGELVLKSRISVEIDCNWKTLRDNFSEAYHVPSVHPTTVAKWLHHDITAIRTFTYGHVELASRRKVERRIGDDGTPAIRNLSDIWSRATIGQQIFPNCILTMEPGAVIIQLFWPAGPSKTGMDLLVVGVAEENCNESYWEAVAKDIDVVLAEDVALLPRVQSSLESGALAGLTLGYQERAIYWYHDEIDRRIGIDRIAEDLRLPQMVWVRPGD